MMEHTLRHLPHWLNWRKEGTLRTICCDLRLRDGFSIFGSIAGYQHIEAQSRVELSERIDVFERNEIRHCHCCGPGFRTGHSLDIPTFGHQDCGVDLAQLSPGKPVGRGRKLKR